MVNRNFIVRGGEEYTEATKTYTVFGTQFTPGLDLVLIMIDDK